jgi:hypothetical protein
MKIGKGFSICLLSLTDDFLVSPNGFVILGYDKRICN